MQKKMRLTGIITQGASRMGTAEYIKAFKVASSFDGNAYTTYKVDGQRRDKVRGRTDIIVNSRFQHIGISLLISPCLCVAGFRGQHR